MTAAAFWDWFSANEALIREDFSTLNNLTSSVLGGLDEGLKAYQEAIGFIIVYDKTLKKHQLTLTIGGDRSYYFSVMNLIDKAPTLANWDFKAFVEPANQEEPDFWESDLVFNGISMTMDEILFRGYGYDSENKVLDLEFLLPMCHKTEDQNDVRHMVYLFLERILGEMRLAKHINYLHLTYVAVGDDNEDFFDLKSLDVYLDSFIEDV